MANKKSGNSFPLRLPPQIRATLETLAKDEAISVNQFIVLAVEEKLTQLEVQQPANVEHHPFNRHRK
jgi:hypothetical protein